VERPHWWRISGLLIGQLARGLCGGVVERKKSSGSGDNDCSDRRTSRVDIMIG